VQEFEEQAKSYTEKALRELRESTEFKNYMNKREQEAVNWQQKERMDDDQSLDTEGS
jgi:hypothetical protein